MDFIQVPFGYVLEFFYSFFENYGIALILFSLAVKLVLLYPSARSKKNMMKMSRLQPVLKQIERACGDDRQKYNLEMQKLYKEEGVSMFGGCLWSLLPLLILLPLYTVIREPLQYMLHLDVATVDAIKAVYAAEIGQEVSALGYYWQYAAAQNIESYVGLIPGLVEGVKNVNFSFLGVDLGQTPQWQIWKTDLSWSAIGGALFPLLSGASNMLSMIISQKTNNTVVSNEKGEHDAAAAASSGKMMTYTMPLVSVIFGFTMPLGISIYWIAQSLFGIVQDYLLTKHYRKVYDAEDAVRREKAARIAAEAEERERIRAAKRAANPDGITENTSKRKQQLRDQQRRDAASKDYENKKRQAQGIAEPEEEAFPGGEPGRPYARGRAYSKDHYSRKED